MALPTFQLMAREDLLNRRVVEQMLVGVEDGYRESTESWATVLRDLNRRGLRAPVVAVGDSKLGFWAAVGAVWAETREQRCWVHYADLRIMPTLVRNAPLAAVRGTRMSA